MTELHMFFIGVGSSMMGWLLPELVMMIGGTKFKIPPGFRLFSSIGCGILSVGIALA